MVAPTEVVIKWIVLVLFISYVNEYVKEGYWLSKRPTNKTNKPRPFKQRNAAMLPSRVVQRILCVGNSEDTCRLFTNFPLRVATEFFNRLQFQ